MIDTLGQNPPACDEATGSAAWMSVRNMTFLKLSFTGISVLPCILPKGAVWR
jgi:hypothetical protein